MALGSAYVLKNMQILSVSCSNCSAGSQLTDLLKLVFGVAEFQTYLHFIWMSNIAQFSELLCLALSVVDLFSG